MLKPYDTVVHGYETTLLLSDEDAEKMGLTAAEPKKAAPAAPAEKPAAKKAPAKKAATPANKARKATQNKSS